MRFRRPYEAYRIRYGYGGRQRDRLTEQDINSVFNRFYKGIAHTGDAGSGLGLYIAKSIIGARPASGPATANGRSPLFLYCRRPRRCGLVSVTVGSVPLRESQGRLTFDPVLRADGVGLQDTIVTGRKCLGEGQLKGAAVLRVEQSRFGARSGCLVDRQRSPAVRVCF